MNEGYCVKCKEKREIQNAEEVVTTGKSGRQTRMLKGVCPVCGTKMNRILGPVKD
jgi:hypothetical protein